MRTNRGLLFWGLALVTAGAVALAVQTGALSREMTAEVWRLWPVILIALGIAILAARTPFALVGTAVAGLVVGGMAGGLLSGSPWGLSACGPGEVTQWSSGDGEFTGASASVELRFNCGLLEVGMNEGSGWSLEAGRSGGPDAQVTADGSSLRVETAERDWVGLVGERHEWTLALPTEVALTTEIRAYAGTARLNLGGGTFGDLDLDFNAGDVTVDLSGAQVADLRVDGNAVSYTMIVDGATGAAGRLRFNAGSAELCASPGTTLAITISGQNITFSHNLDSSGLERVGDTWRTPGTSGVAPVQLGVGGNATSFTLNPAGGC